MQLVYWWYLRTIKYVCLKTLSSATEGLREQGDLDYEIAFAYQTMLSCSEAVSAAKCKLQGELGTCNKYACDLNRCLHQWGGGGVRGSLRTGIKGNFLPRSENQKIKFLQIREREISSQCSAAASIARSPSSSVA